MELVGEERSRRYARYRDAAGSSLAKAASGSTGTFWWSATLKGRSRRQAPSRQQRPFLKSALQSPPASFARACQQMHS